VLLKLNELNDKTSAAAGGTGENALQAKRVSGWLRTHGMFVQINELYDAVQKYSELSGALPDLCARLIVLQQLHEQCTWARTHACMYIQQCTSHKLLPK
jgi:hypothetical protein